MKNIHKAILLMWLVFALCLIEPICSAYVDSIEELATTFVMLSLALLTDKIIAYLMLALAVGKLIDGQVAPYGYNVNEFLWDIVCFAGAIVLYIHRKRKAKQTSNGN